MRVSPMKDSQISQLIKKPRQRPLQKETATMAHKDFPARLVHEADDCLSHHLGRVEGWPRPRGMPAISRRRLEERRIKGGG